MRIMRTDLSNAIHSWLALGLIAISVAGLSTLSSLAPGQQRSQDASSTTSKPKTSEAESANGSAAIPANLIVKLRERVGKETVVTGHIERTSRSKGGHHFLNFASSELTIVCFEEHARKFKDQPPAEAFKGKDVTVTGKIELYQGKLQIKLEDPAQIRIVKAGPRSTAKAIELKQLEPGVWVSPAGLRYAGRDPAGLTRVEHIRRHVKDQPDRAGPHGVFDGGDGVAFAIIDEAWQLAEQKGLTPQRDGQRSTYLVSLGRRIGFLGGEEGKQRGHPPLQRVFIVFETGTKNIITAYPR
jgi:hypothetical protein